MRLTDCNEISRIQNNRFADSLLGHKLDDFQSHIVDGDTSLAKSEVAQDVKYRNCPIENGQWDGIRGESEWIPNMEFIPLKMNPEGKTWKEVLENAGIDGIVYKEGEPDFSKISEATVEIDSFSSYRDENFAKADIALAKQKEVRPEEIAKWRKENGYTWHECRDMKTMQLVPSIIHNNVPHSGGISEIKKGA